MATKKKGSTPPGRKAGSTIPAEEAALSKRLESLRKIDKPTESTKADIKEAADKLKALRFTRIANKRVPKVLKSIRALLSLAGPSYAPTPEQRQKVTEALQAAVKEVVQRFEGTQAATETGFSV